MTEYIDDLSVKVVSKAQYLGLRAKETVRDFFTKENGDVNVVSIVILIGVAVALAVIFKDKAKSLITTLMNNVTTKANEAMSTN